IFTVVCQGPDVPAVLDRISLDNAVVIATDGDWLYVGLGTEGLQVYDLTEPANPQLRGSFGSEEGFVGYTNDIEIIESADGQKIVLLAGDTGGLFSLLVDEADPDNTVSLLDTEIDPSVSFKGIAVHGDLACIVGGSSGLLCYDISNPSSLRLLASTSSFVPSLQMRRKYQNNQYSLELIPYYFSDAVAVETYSHYALVAERAQYGRYFYDQYSYVRRSSAVNPYGGWVGVFDISDPTRPTRAGMIRLDGQQLLDMDLLGDRLYLATEDGLVVYDISRPNAPKRLGFLQMDLQTLKVSAVHDTAMVTTAAGMYFIDVSDPRHMTVQYYLDDNLSSIGAGEVIGRNIFLPGSGLGVLRLDGEPLGQIVVDKKQTVMDDNDVPVTIRISGGGQIRVHTDTLGEGYIERLEIYNTTLSTRVTVRTPKRQTTTIGDIDVSGPLKSLSAKTTVVTGDIIIEGPIRKLTLGDVGDGLDRWEQTLTIGNAPEPNPKAAVTIKLGRVEDLRIESDITIKSITAAAWFDDESDWSEDPHEVPVDVADYIAAPALGRLKITGARAYDGDLQADLIVGEGEGSLGYVKIDGNLTGSWFAKDVKSVSVGGNVDGFTMELTQPVTANKRLLALGKMKVAGKIVNTSIRTAGSIGAISAGAMENSVLFAGVKADYDVDVYGGDGNGDGVLDLPTATGQFAEAVDDVFASIKSLTIRGSKALTGDLFINSNVAAGAIGKVTVREVLLDSDDVPFGFAAADSLKSLSWLQGRERYRWGTAGWPEDTEDLQATVFGQ
ncbi:MAG: hypothetical protein HQ546_10425, partial [Planctomycetes bacterium]|nr:hypothetical protein [Planctomycetota bacterium]